MKLKEILLIFGIVILVILALVFGWLVFGVDKYPPLQNNEASETLAEDMNNALEKTFGGKEPQPFVSLLSIKELSISSKMIENPDYTLTLGSDGDFNTYFSMWNNILKECANVQKSDYCAWSGNVNASGLIEINSIINK